MYSPRSLSLKAICCSNFVCSSSFIDDHSVIRILFSNSSCSRIDLFSLFIDWSRLTSSIGSALSYSSSKSISSGSHEAIFFICYNYYLLTGCKGRTKKYKSKVFHTARACEGCFENQGLVFPGTA